MAFVRLRRLRENAPLRDLVSETKLAVGDFIMPYFVTEGKNKRQPIESMPGIYRLSIDNLIKDIKEARRLGIKAVLLFGIATKKDDSGTEAYRGGAVQKAIKEIKKDIKDIVIITDVCLCGYTTHGHCGILRAQSAQRKAQNELFINNDETVKILAKVALSHAEAGADFVAPSAMMDGQVKTIREVLNNHGLEETGILAYSAKYASNFYGPFREALDSRPQFGDRRSYQMDFRNSDEALSEIRQDINEGADIVMVKPALSYLDIIRRAKQDFNVPLAAYNVSGEYSLVKLGSAKGLFDEKKAVLEVLTSIKRAGADLIITYHAKEAAGWLKA